MKTAVLLASLVLGAVPGAAQAQTYSESLPMTGATPANGTHLDPGSGPVPWEIDGSVKNTDESIHILVTSQNTLGGDGTLDQTNLKDYFSLGESTTPGTYSGQSVGGAGRWQNTPGTYYWQAVAEFQDNPDDVSSPTHYYRSKVFTIKVGGTVADDPAPTPTQPAPGQQPPTHTPTGVPAVKPATTLHVYSHSIVHGHAKLLAGCIPGPCWLQATTVVMIGKKAFPATTEVVPLANSLTQHFYVAVDSATAHAIKAALKRHRSARLYVGVKTFSPTGSPADLDFITWKITRVA